MTLSNVPKLVTVFGGSGFLGRHIVRTLAKRGYRIRVAVRRPDLAFHLQPLGNVGQISLVQANLRYRNSVDAAVRGSDYVINCVGLLHESGRNTFDGVQEFGARAVAEAARAAGVGLTHISAIGADISSRSAYARTKGRAEKAILEILPDAVILRPSVVFGPEDDFYNKFADMARKAPALPLVGGGKTRFQPVYVDDVAEAVARAADGLVKGGKIYELGGAEIKSFKEILDDILEITCREQRFVPLPFFVASLIGKVSSLIPFVKPPITADQVILLKSDNVVSKAAIAEGRTLEGLGIKPTLAAAILPTYLQRFRPEGQFTQSGSAA
ncbi:complex I NDUFA9 subunit family protein [Rhizobium sp. KVB221]|uniref:Complex I NDUFA9 subunit family protein n=1 Tax=Rhizobium setariae TaxID=2801340 RepID=A0A936YK81_9HYPH|nr:complex I NDUFA9 subunit family protein [Rhizobium setariae]MBL0371758.1 complex I NDUFA9 subunit family protein [Rhizobium setariae]